jgi:hypothetical protein
VIHPRRTRPAPARAICALLALGAVAACTEPQAQEPTESGVSATAALDERAGSARGEVSVDDDAVGTEKDHVELTVGGSPFAGTHQLSGEFGCSVIEGLRMWSGGSGLNSNRRGISEAAFSIQGVPASGGSTEEVEFWATFGQIDDDTGNFGMAGIGQAVGGGKGRATVRREGRGAMITVQGTGVGGTTISATVRCRTLEVVD